MEAALSFASASCGTRTVDPHWPIHAMRTTGGHKTHAFGPQVSCAADMVALSRFQGISRDGVRTIARQAAISFLVRSESGRNAYFVSRYKLVHMSMSTGPHA